MTKKEIVDNYIKDNHQKIQTLKSETGFRWQTLANELNEFSEESITGEYIRGRFRDYVKDSCLKTECTKENCVCKDNVNTSLPGYLAKYSFQENKEKGEAKLEFTADNVPSEEEIVEWFKIDTKKYRIAQIYHKTSFSGKYSITVNLMSNKSSEIDYVGDFQKFVDTYNVNILKKDKPNKVEGREYDPEEDFLFIINLADIHIGNFQKEGYVEKIKNRVREIINGVSVMGLKKILIVNNGDLIHFDNSKNTTYNSTGLTGELDYESAVTQGLDLLTDIIDYAALAALTVTFINVRGNHSFDTEFIIGEALKRIYKGSTDIEIINQKDTRIYYYWNNCGFMFTHGDMAIDKLPLIFATEGGETFSKAAHRTIILGHTHVSKNRQYLSPLNEYNGIEMRIVGSPTSNDNWHRQQGYVQGKKTLVSFIFTPEEGKYAEYNFKIS